MLPLRARTSLPLLCLYRSPDTTSSERSKQTGMLTNESLSASQGLYVMALVLVCPAVLTRMKEATPLQARTGP